jgi:uncharacterized protein
VVTLHSRRNSLIAVVVGLILAGSAMAQTFPSLTGRVVDEAGILDQPARDALTEQLAALETKTTDQLVVVTVRSLQGLAIEEYGVRLARQWQIGQKNKNNGVVLLVAPTDRKVRIEVGYGLEGTLPDAVSNFIIQQSILPRFRDNDMPGGIARGIDDIINVLTGDAAEWQQRAVRAQPTLFSRTMRGLFHVMSWLPEDFIIIIGLLVLGSILSLVSLVWLRVCLPVLLMIGIAVGLVSKDRWRALAQRQAKWQFLDFGTTTSGSSSSSGSSWSSGSSGFSGGGGSFGGGGSSGSW